MIKVLKRKNIWLVVSAFAFSLMLADAYSMKAHACEAVVAEQNNIIGNGTGISPMSIIEWRYKLVDGVLYRRKYNYTEECWVGDWEVVPLVEA